MPEKVKFRACDVTVISILWSYELVNYWIKSLCHYTMRVLFTHDEPQSGYFKYHLTWIIFVSCFATLIVALLVESFGHKYAVSLGGLCISLCTPFIAVFTCIARDAGAAVLMFWTSSSLFIVSPATYSLVFNQNLDPMRNHVRFLVSTFECMESLFGKYLIFLYVPSRARGTDHEQDLIIVVWVIVTPLLVTLIIFVERMKKQVTGNFINERGMKRILYGIRRDIKIQPPRRTGRSMCQVILFVLLLLPALSLTALDAALSNANSDDETNTQSPTLKHILFSVQLMIIPVMELGLSLTPSFKETTLEMMILGLAHVVNIAVVSFLVYRMDQISDDGSGLRTMLNGKPDVLERLRDSSDINLNRPGAGFYTYLIFTSVDVRLQTVPQALFAGGSDIEELRTNSIIHGSDLVPPHGTRKTFELITTRLPGTESSPSISDSYTLYEKKHYTFFITGNSTYLKVWVVPWMELIPVKPVPQLVYLNSIADEEIDGVPIRLKEQVFRIKSTAISFSKKYDVPEVGQSVRVDLPVGEVDVSYVYLGNNPKLVNRLQADPVTKITEPYGVYLAFPIFSKQMVFNVVKLFYSPPVTTTTSSPATTSFSSETTEQQLIPKEPDAIQQSSYAMLGATFGIASVGYTHFFWVESPLRLRAVLYALFRVSNVLVGWFTETVVGRTLTRPEAIVLLILQVFTTVWHLGLSWIFHEKVT